MATESMSTDKNLARLMVRRHLRSWLGSDIISEELLIAMFLQTMRRNPDLAMRDVSTLVDAEIKELVAIVLGADLPDLDEQAGL